MRNSVLVTVFSPYVFAVALAALCCEFKPAGTAAAAPAAEAEECEPRTHTKVCDVIRTRS